MLRYLIGKIRQQPKPVRNNIALGVAGIFTAVVFSIWAYNLPVKMGDITFGGDSSEGTFSQIFEQVTDQIATVKEGIPDELTKSGEGNPLNPLVEEYKEAVADVPTESLVGSTSATSAATTTAASTSSSSVPEETLQREVRIVTTKPTTTASTSDSE